MDNFLNSCCCVFPFCLLFFHRHHHHIYRTGAPHWTIVSSVKSIIGITLSENTPVVFFFFFWDKIYSFMFDARGKKISNWKNWAGSMEKDHYSEKNVGLWLKFLVFQSKKNILMTIVRMHSELARFSINSYNSMFSLEELQLNCLVAIFWKRNISKINTKKANAIKNI